MIERTESGVRLHLYVQPGGKKSEVLGEHDGALKVRIQARPVEGQANAAIVDFVAKTFGVSRSKVNLIRGEKSRQKVVEITGLTLGEARAVVQGLVGRPSP